MTPKKIIFYTRPVEAHFHIELARKFVERFGDVPIVFVSFFSQAIEYIEAQGYQTLYIPEALQQSRQKLISESRVKELDAFCRQTYMGLNAMLQMERFLPEAPDNAYLFMQQHLTVLDELIEPQTLSISSMYDHFVYLAAGMLTFEKGGAHFAFVGCGVPGGRVLALRRPDEPWINRKSSEDSGELYETAVKELDMPPEQRISYMKPLKMDRNLAFSERINLARRRAAHGKRDHRMGSYFAGLQMNWWQNAVCWRFKAWRERMRNEDPWDIHDDGELQEVSGPCVFLALHMEPEATILMYSPRQRDQIEACRLVAESLPVGVTLLVKENPKMLNKRPRGYYEKIKRFPNVRLCSTAVSSVTLIRKSQAVVSLGGTVTIEARLRGKAAFCFGNPPFHSMATACGQSILDKLSEMDFEREDTAEHLILGDDPAWCDWVRGNFVGIAGKVRFSSEFGQDIFDDSPANAEAFANYIESCVS
ncbi:MAG: hypothetical protein ACSHX4_01230 [Opitutaceae bacterium]